MDLTSVIRELKKEDLDSASEAAFLKYITDPVLELFDTAYSEWKTHHVYASRDRLELFFQHTAHKTDALSLNYE